MVLINPVISNQDSTCCRTLTLILRCAGDGCGASVLNKYRQFVGSEDQTPAQPYRSLTGAKHHAASLKSFTGVMTLEGRNVHPHA